MQANLWTRFCQTGKISDYLAWKQTAQTAEQPKRIPSNHAHKTMLDSTGTAGR